MKKTRTKAICAALAAVMILSLSACAGSEKGGSPDTASSSSVREDTTKKTTTTTADESSDPEDDSSETDDSEEQEAPLPDEDPPAEEKLKSPVLKEIGKLDSKDIQISNHAVIYNTDDEGDTNCLDRMGRDIDGGDTPYVEKVGGSGLYAYCRNSDDIVHQGLIDAEGNVILGVSEGAGCFESINERFVKAYIPEGETKNKDEAIYSVSADRFGFMSKDSDTMYKGTIKVFDLETKKFLEKTAVTCETDYTAHGDIISFIGKDNELVNVRADDTYVDEKREYSITGDGFLVENGAEKNIVYDHDLNKLFSTEYFVFELDDSSYYYRIQDNESKKSGVMSEKGRTIIEPAYDSLFGLAEDWFTYSNNDDGKRGLLKADGTEVTKDEYKYFSILAPGFFTAKKDDDRSVILNSEGRVLFTETDDEKLYCYDDIAPYTVKDGKYVYFVYDKESFALELEAAGDYFGDNILYSSGEKVLYDIVTGEKLLDGFDSAYSVYGCVYVQNGDEITVYEVN